MKKSHPSGIGTPEMANNEATRSKEIFGSVGVRGFYSLGTFDPINNKPPTRAMPIRMASPIYNKSSQESFPTNTKMIKQKSIPPKPAKNPFAIFRCSFIITMI